MRITPTGATLGAVISGVSLADLASADWGAIEAAFHRYALLIFPAQHLDEPAQAAFARRFGRIEVLVEGRNSVPISNQRADGSLLQDHEHGMQIMRGNEGWHTDSSYMPLAARASVLSARVVPSRGGETEWADMRAAWEALEPALQQRIQGLSAHHSLMYSQAQIGHRPAPGASYGFRDELPPLRPLVKIHPVTGRPALCIGRHAYAVPGLAAAESDALLAGLLAGACRAPRTWRHSWQAGDLAVWDNRCVLHRACPFDHAEPRVMLHTRVAGDPAFETGEPADAAALAAYAADTAVASAGAS